MAILVVKIVRLDFHKLDIVGGKGFDGMKTFPIMGGEGTVFRPVEQEVRNGVS